MKCPFCAEQIQDDAIKCKHCSEWLLRKAYLFPSVKEKGNALNTFVFTIDGFEYRVERHQDGRIEVSKDTQLVQTIEKEKGKKLQRIEANGHTLAVQWKDAPNIVLVNLLWWNTGLRILVDGKPVEGTVDDPAEKMKLASYALYFFAGVYFLSVALRPDYVALAAGGGVVALLLGVLTKKAPLLTTSLGSLFGIYEVVMYCKNYGPVALETTGSSMGFYWFLFWVSLRTGATIVLVQGFIAGWKLRSLKERFMRG